MPLRTFFYYYHTLPYKKSGRTRHSCGNTGLVFRQLSSRTNWAFLVVIFFLIVATVLATLSIIANLKSAKNPPVAYNSMKTRKRFLFKFSSLLQNDVTKNSHMKYIFQREICDQSSI